MPQTRPRWVSSVRSTLPAPTSYIGSSDADASLLPSGENTKPQTGHEPPSSVRSAFLVPTSHTYIVRSSDAEASLLPLGENATFQTQPKWGLGRPLGFPSTLTTYG